MQDHRRHYRVDPRPFALRGLLRHRRGADHPARVLDLSARGMRLLLPADVTAPRRGATLRIQLQSPHLHEPIQTLATVIQADRTLHATVMGLQIRDWPGVRDTVPAALLPAFNVRSARRYRLDQAQLPVEVAGVWMCFQSTGLLRDVSERGVGFTAEPTAEGHLRLTREVRLQFQLPDDERGFDLRGQVCRRAINGLSTRYGAELASDDEPEVRRQFLRIQNWIERQRRRAATTARPRRQPRRPSRLRIAT